MSNGGYIYIVSNKNRTVLYTGVTSNLHNRIYEHKNGLGAAFTKKYNCTDLLYYEFFADIESAIQREKRIKKYKREWKENLIKEMNLEMRDLFDEVSEMQ
ncbi:MAG: GIY-YIG nuclease family protein [Reichenbachiella sp.]|uniref:GIY-YIG nuclease family protein n=1 Tax=Reichenbachiella sp. TaxID=2184521 RepID=UPI0032998A9D